MRNWGTGAISFFEFYSGSSKASTLSSGCMLIHQWSIQSQQASFSSELWVDQARHKPASSPQLTLLESVEESCLLVLLRLTVKTHRESYEYSELVRLPCAWIVEEKIRKRNVYNLARASRYDSTPTNSKSSCRSSWRISPVCPPRNCCHKQRSSDVDVVMAQLTSKTLPKQECCRSTGFPCLNLPNAHCSQTLILSTYTCHLESFNVGQGLMITR